MKTSLTISFAFVLSLGSASLALGATPKSKGEADLMNPEGKRIGTVMLEQKKDGLHLKVKVSDLSPGDHGFHFHENAKCEGPDFKSAGGHLNPTHVEHGLENPKGPHAGDMPNLTVKADGTADTEIVTKNARLSGLKSIVIHAKADDQHSSPAGNSGDRVACGIVR